MAPPSSARPGQRAQRRASSIGTPAASTRLPSTYNDVSGSSKDNKDPLQAVGEETVLAVQQGGYQTSDGQRHNIGEACRTLHELGTRFHPPDNPLLDNWRLPAPQARPTTLSSDSDTLDVHFRLQSTLSAAREWAWSARAPYERIGVLNCAHPTIPGSGFNVIGGAFKSQEASLSRASNLSYALFSPAATPFYKLHKTNQGTNNGFYSNGMIYTRDVTLVRDDLHEWAFPLQVDVLSATPIDANEVKWVLVDKGGMSQDTMRRLVAEALEERMGRILRLFEVEGDNVLILTGFGAGACGNPMGTIARLWAKLLGPGGRFYGKFANVIFAMPSDMLFHKFSSSFNAAITRSPASG